MKSYLREIIQENQLEAIKTYVPREREVHCVSGKATTIVGVRRCGKTTYLKQILDTLRSKPANKMESALYINFFDERLYGVKAKDLGLIIDAYHELNPDLSPHHRVYCFFDEIQIIKGWEFFIDRLLRQKQFHVFLTGSSSTLLSKEIATAMRGRSLSTELFPYNFKEFCLADGLKDPGMVTSQERGKLISKLKSYLINGGFPEVSTVNRFLRRTILQEYLDVALFKDVIERYNPSDPMAASHTLRLLMHQIGQLFTINKTCDRLKSMGLKVTKTEISQFVQWFEDCYLLFTVPIYTNSISKQIVNPRKLFCIDTGLAFHTSQGLSENKGRLLENAVFMKLRQLTESIYYFKDSAQREVDFIFMDQNKKPQIVQVCLSLSDQRTREREMKAVVSCMDELKQKSATIVTLDERDEIQLGSKKIIIVPAWEYLLKN